MDPGVGWQLALLRYAKDLRHQYVQHAVQDLPTNLQDLYELMRSQRNGGGAWCEGVAAARLPSFVTRHVCSGSNQSGETPASWLNQGVVKAQLFVVFTTPWFEPSADSVRVSGLDCREGRNRTIRHQ